MIKTAKMIREKKHRLPREVPAYCFMPDHAHVLIQGADDLADTWQAMKGFKQHIVNNPVRAGLVARWDEYPYSGAFPHDLRDILASALE